LTTDRLPHDELFLRGKLQRDPSDWEIRRRLAHALFDKEAFDDAAETIWKAEQIPGTDLDIAFSARILAKAQPSRAIRLLAAVLELNRGKAVQNMGMANALLHHGLVLQAARFYGAALDADPTLVNPELEHFILWTDDELTLWGKFEEGRPKLGELPWMARDPKEALRLTSSIKLHSTPLSVPSLPAVPGEQIRQKMYQQEAKLNGKLTPPPAVTIPIDRVAPKYRRFDSTYGATITGAQAQTPAPVPEVVPEGIPEHPVTTKKPRLILSSPGPISKPATTSQQAPQTQAMANAFAIPTRPMAVNRASAASKPPTRAPVPPRS
jgi:hypothetical protein